MHVRCQFVTDKSWEKCPTGETIGKFRNFRDFRDKTWNSAIYINFREKSRKIGVLNYELHRYCMRNRSFRTTNTRNIFI
jgi:hypothetical protein